MDGAPSKPDAPPASLRDLLERPAGATTWADVTAACLAELAHVRRRAAKVGAVLDDGADALRRFGRATPAERRRALGVAS